MTLRLVLTLTPVPDSELNPDRYREPEVSGMDFVRVSPAQWPARELKVQPGDLSLFVPPGLGLGGPFPVRPWDDPLSSPAGYYGFQQPAGHPLRDAPVS